MQQTKIFTSSIAVMIAAFLILVTVPVFAETGSGESGDDASTSTTTTERKRHGSDDNVALVSDDDSDEKTEANETRGSDRGKLQSEGARLLAEAKKSHKSEKSAENRKKTCESRKQGLDQKFTRITANSERFQSKIAGVQQKAEDYKTANNIELSNYDELVSAANVAKEASASSIASLKEVKPTVDCNSASVAGDIATFKAAAQNTRDNLKAYRTAVKSLLKALHDAKEPAETADTTEGGN